MKRVIVKTIDAGPQGVRHPGTTHTVSDDEARDMVKGGFAEYADAQPAETAAVKPVVVAPVYEKRGGKRR